MRSGDGDIVEIEALITTSHSKLVQVNPQSPRQF